MEEKILNLLTQPMKTGEVAEATGIEKKEVEKNHQKAREGGQSGVAETLLLCGSKITGPSERGYQSDIRMPPAQKNDRKRRGLLRFPVVGFNGIMSRKEVN